MRLTSINVGAALRLGDMVTGICKTRQSGPVAVTQLGLVGDAVCDKKFHGGLDQALYVYGGDDYAFWSDSHGLDLAPGTFGDNLTISDLSSLTVRVGDRFRINDVLLEATAPRIPCATLARRMNDPKFPVAFRKSQRSGFYCRVLQEGTLYADSAIQHTPTSAPNPLTIVAMFKLYYEPNPSRSSLEHALKAHIAVRDRERFDARLEKLDG